MTRQDLIALIPLIVLSSVSVLEMLIVAFHRHHGLAALSALASLVLAFVTLPVALLGDAPHQVAGLLIINHFSLFYMGLIFAAAFVVVVLSYGYMKRQKAEREELYILILLATMGGAILIASSHFFTLFLGLEILTVSLYAMIGYLRELERCVEAATKYLILAAVSSSFLLFGMALVYSEYPSMEFRQIAGMLARSSPNLIFLTGLAMMVVGIGFKLALVPFHMWTPDVYEGAPAPVTAFVATVSKGAMFALLLRFFGMIDVRSTQPVYLAFVVVSIASMFGGNLLALLQRNVKRILAYSSIAHLGYVLVAFLANGPMAVVAATFYLVAYFVTTLTAFGVVTVLSGKDDEADRIEQYRGMAWRHPWMGGILTAALLSLAGIPLTAGFLGKFSVLAVGVDARQWVLVASLVISSGIGLYYYLRIVVTIYGTCEKDTEPGEAGRRQAETGTAFPVIPPLSKTGSIVLGTLTVVLIWLGVLPGSVLDLIRSMVAEGF